MTSALRIHFQPKLCGMVLSGLAATFNLAAPAQTPPVTVAATPATPAAPVDPLAGLKFDAMLKEASPTNGQPTQSFVYAVTNASDENIVIDHVHASCGCTTAKLPSEPWTLTPGQFGNINVSVNLAGKQGTFQKTVYVYSTNQQFKVDLALMIHMPESPMVSRVRNQQLAMADQQMVFKGDCASCHGDPVTHGLMGKELYQKACGICHDSPERDSKVPDLHNLSHPVDLAFWKAMISTGKPGTMMPGFSVARGGPLTDEQIDSLARICNQAFIPTGAGMPVKTSQNTPHRSGMVPPPVQSAN